MTRFVPKTGRVCPPMFRNFFVALSYTILLGGGVGMTDFTSGQEPAEERIAALKENLQLETQAMKRHLAELIEAGRKDEAEATERQLVEFQRNIEMQIRELRGDRPSENKQPSQKQDQSPRKRSDGNPKRRVEQQEKREEIERPREPNNRDSNRRDNEPAPEAERVVRELYEQLTQAIKQRQPERVVELSHQIAHHLREPQNHQPPRRERSPQGNPGPESPNQRREDRPRNDGPQHNGPQHNGPQHNGPQHNGPQHNGPQHEGPGPDLAHEMRMMVQELRGELHQLRRELDELRRERH